MSNTDHLNSESLILFLDGELGEQKRLEAHRHLSVCEVCRSKRDQFADLSARVEGLVAAQPVGEGQRSWQSVSAIADSRTAAAGPTPSTVMKRFAWGMALAATLALGLVLAPKGQTAKHPQTPAAARLSASSIEVDGENFVALPYSNPDLPVNASRIVEMQVPVSSLEAAGILLPLDPDGSGDRTVAANVLLGLDGQPLAVDVLNVD